MRISDWSSDVCSSDLGSSIYLHKSTTDISYVHDIQCVYTPEPLDRFKHTHLNAQSSGSSHVYQRIKTKNIDFSAHQVRDAGLGHAKKLGGFGDRKSTRLNSSH